MQTSTRYLLYINMKLFYVIYIFVLLCSCNSSVTKEDQLIYGFQLGMDYEDFYQNVNHNIRNKLLILYDYTPPPLIIDADTFMGNPFKKIKILINSDQKEYKYWNFEPVFFNDKLLYLQLSNDSIQDIELAGIFFEKVINFKWEDKDTISYKTVSKNGSGFSLRKLKDEGIYFSIVDKQQYDLRDSLMEMVIHS